MKAVLQRVKKVTVSIDNNVYSEINAGLLILLCIEKLDSDDSLDWLANKVVSLRCFEDENGKMNKSVKDINGEILVVSQFTLAADCKKGTRPSFDNAEKPEIANSMSQKFVKLLQNRDLTVKTGVFAADMQVSLVNDGPVTFVLNK